MKKTRIVHLTSAHPRYDTRIFIKMCSSLAKHDYEVMLVVADGKGYEKKNKVKIYDVGCYNDGSRIRRMFLGSLKVYKMALLLNAEIYHIHDPELLPYALLLKHHGKKVIFDSHEDYPGQILGKPYLNKAILNAISILYKLFQNFVLRKIDYIIAATPFIKEILKQINHNTIDINNFPIIKELSYSTKFENKKSQVCYIGGITLIRGCKEIVTAMQFVKNDVKLALVGNYENEDLKNNLMKNNGWNKVIDMGYLNRKEINNVLSDSFAGLVLIYPEINYINSLPTKMFEYMLAGIPVIASNFPFWKTIVEDNNCGMCIDPLKPEQIAETIDYLYEHPDKAKIMGENGRKTVLEKYNYSYEEQKLFNVYYELKSRITYS